MYNFNLLPEAYQKKIRHWIIAQHISNGLLLFNICLISLLALMWIGNNTLQYLIHSTSASLTAEQDSQENSVGQNIRDINTRIQAIAEIQKQHPQYLSLLKNLFSQLPDDLTLSNISIDYKNTKITLTGTAKNRTALQALQSTIERNKTFEITAFPFEIFTQSENIPFTIEMTFTAT